MAGYILQLQVKSICKGLHPQKFSERSLQHYCTLVCLRWMGMVSDWKNAADSAASPWVRWSLVCLQVCFQDPFLGCLPYKKSIQTHRSTRLCAYIYICISRYGWVAISILIYHKKWPLSFNSFFRLKMAQVWLGKDKVTFSGRCLQPLLCVSGFAAKVARLSST